MANPQTTLASVLGNTRLLSFDIGDGVPDGDDPTSNTRWHQIALEGEWDGHWQGPFSLTRRDFEQIELNAQRNVDTLVDYEHSSLKLFMGGKAEAAAWISALQIRDGDDGVARLFGRFDWTPVAAKHIRDREYRYLSPAIGWKTRDRKTGTDLGAALLSVALTNTPFLEELPEVRLNSAVALAHLQAKEQVTMALSQEQFAQLTGALGLSADAKPEDAIAAVALTKTRSASMERICAALSLDASSDVEVVASAVAALKAKADDAPDATELEQLRGEMRAMQASGAIEKATREGKIVASNRDWATKLAQKDLEEFEAWSASAVPAVQTEVKRPRSGATAASAAPTEQDIASLVAQLGEDDLHICSQLNLRPEDYVKANLEQLRDQ